MGGFCSGVSKPLGLRAAGDTLGPACSTSAALEQLPDERNGIGGVLRSHEPQSATPPLPLEQSTGRAPLLRHHDASSQGERAAALLDC